MIAMAHRFHVEIEVEDKTGEVTAAYFQIREGKATKVKEFADGAVFANYNRRGELLGVEMLAPCEVRVLDKIAEQEPKPLRKQTKNFLRKSAPLAMLGDLIGAS
jgi:hypothetical protein